MNRIDTINARENMFGVGKSGFHDNSDLPGQDATYVSPEWFNTVQEELCNLLELRGITLDPASKRQLYDLLTTQADLEALADEIETNFIRKSQIVDNLTTSDATKPLSAKQGKDLQDNKLAKDELVNNLTSGGADKALTAEQGKVLLNMFASNLNSSGYQKIANPSNPLKPLIIQWGEIPSQAMTNSQAGRQTFNVSFPNACFNVFISSTAGVTTTDNSSEGFQKTSSDQFGFDWVSHWGSRNSTTNTNAAISFFAVGN